jgi:hypothetical protein
VHILLYRDGKRTFYSKTGNDTKEQLASCCQDLREDVTEEMIKNIIVVAQALIHRVYGKQPGQFQSLNQLRANMYAKSV